MRRVVSPWPKKRCWFHLPGKGLCLPSSTSPFSAHPDLWPDSKPQAPRGWSPGRDSWWSMMYNERTAWFCQFMLIRIKETRVEWFQMVWDQIGRKNKVGSSQTDWHGPLKQRFQIQCVCSRGRECSNSLPSWWTEIWTKRWPTLRVAERPRFPWHVAERCYWHGDHNEQQMSWVSVGPIGWATPWCLDPYKLRRSRSEKHSGLTDSEFTPC